MRPGPTVWDITRLDLTELTPTRVPQPLRRQKETRVDVPSGIQPA